MIIIPGTLIPPCPRWQLSQSSVEELQHRTEYVAIYHWVTDAADNFPSFHKLRLMLIAEIFIFILFHQTVIAISTVAPLDPLACIKGTYMVWWSGVVVSALASINEVNQRRARLVLRWVTVSGFNSWWRTFISACDQPPRSTQPGHPFVGRRNEYQPKGGDALRLGSKGRYGSCVGGR